MTPPIKPDKNWFLAGTREPGNSFPVSIDFINVNSICGMIQDSLRLELVCHWQSSKTNKKNDISFGASVNRFT